ncbi:MAG: hypothetical protein DCC49_05470 [Acidobacteria bacterium]|nr:MAG: hypothetical protein DCC49_05470 [Acidobacteriota bacterium]
MRKHLKLIPIALAALLLSGCELTSPAVSSVNSSVTSQAWLNQAVSYFEGDPVMQSAAGIRPPQYTDPTGQVQGSEPSRADLERKILEREMITQLFESEIFKRGFDPEPWIERDLPKMEQAVQTQYGGRKLPPQGAIELLNRWNATAKAFVAVSTGLPDQPTRQAIATIFEKLPVAGRKVCMSVIAVNSQEKVAQVTERLAKKESFKAVAAEFSDHQPSKPRQGDVGCLTITEATQIFQDPAVFRVAMETPPGTSTGPFKGGTGLSWWVRVAETGNAGGDLESATPQIVAQYEGARGALAEDEYVKALERSDMRAVCPVGRWFNSGPFKTNPIMLSCDEPVPNVLDGGAVEVAPSGEQGG